jgi:uncharacterized SAM-dependent methyltransferase
MLNLNEEEDFLRLLKEKGDGSYFKYSYKYNTNKDYYGMFIRNENYYVFNEEVDLIKSNADKFKSIIGTRANVIEIGPGSLHPFECKTMPFLCSLENIASYASIDIHHSFAVNALNAFKNKFPNANGCAFSADLLDENGAKFVEYFKSIDKKVIVNFGSMIMNISKSDREKFFKFVSNFMNSGDLFLIGIDTNHDPASVIKAYAVEANDEQMLNVMRYFKQTFQLDFDADAFRVAYEWETDEANYSGNVRCLIIANRLQHFKWLNGDLLSINEGDKFYINANRRFKQGYIEQVGAQHNMKIISIFKNQNDRVNLFLLRKD